MSITLRHRRRRRTAGLAALALMATSLVGTGLALAAPAAAADFPAIDDTLQPSTPTVTPVSEADTAKTASDRITLNVDGEPFFYNGTQLRIDKLRDAWGLSEQEIAALFHKIKDDGFTVVNVPLWWAEVQPDRVFSPVESTYIRGGQYSRTNFADSPSSKIGYQRGVEEEKQLTYLKFDFSGYTEAEINAAKVRVNLNADAIGDLPFTAKLYGITDDSWDAATMTWDEGAPNHNGHAITGTEGEDYVLVDSSPSWDQMGDKQAYDFDVSDFIANSPDKTVSFILQATPTTDTDLAVGGTIDGALGAEPPQLFLSNQQRYDFSYLDKVIGWAEAAEIKLEFLWYGSDSTGATLDNRVPTYVFRNHKNQYINADGVRQPVLKKIDDPKYGVYWYHMDKNDLRTRSQEYTALKATMDHVAEYNAANGDKKTLIGVQVSNEPSVQNFHGSKRTHWHNPETWGALDRFASVGDFVDRTMWEFTVNLSNAVKESDYPVWTRVNNCNCTDAFGVEYNELMRQNHGTSLDFIGLDPYSRDEGRLYRFGHEGLYSTGSNLPMINENGGDYQNSANLLLASLAGGAFYNVYDYYGPDGHNLYVPKDAANGDYTPVPRGSYMQEVRDTNHMLLKAAGDLASKQAEAAGGTKLQFLNPLSDLGASAKTTVRAIGVDYHTPADGVGVVVERADDEIALLSSDDATYSLHGIGRYGIASVESGRYDGSTWVKSGDVKWSWADRTITFDVPAYGAVRVVTNAAIPAAGPDVPFTDSSFSATQEAESLSPASNVGLQQWDDGASNGAWIKVLGTGTGDYVEFTVPRPSQELDSYELAVGYRTSTGRGIAQASVGGTDVGKPLDMYADGSQWREAVVGDLAFGGASSVTLRFTVTGKNAASSGYQFGFDYFTLRDAVDKSDLYALTYDFAGEKQSDHSAGWQEFSTALTAAETVLGDGSATQAAVDSAYADLRAGVNGLDRVLTTDLPVRHSSKCMDVTGASTADGAEVIQWTCNGHANQRWRLQGTGDGYYRLVAQHSAKCLDVTSASTANGAGIIQYACNGGANQQWRVSGTGGYVQFVARHSGKCLDVTDASMADGARIQQWDCNSGHHQQWDL
ncbi:RICIN domain-containing protein [Streptomyces dysideae]|uniref:Ricin B lectin domain-containing protein n=1 Tax=Streptomyces dysideae TaxID=909626 RepID=A0A117RYA0_9ACTN|nr:RICIN domain-containing protein [Streptomyces dysideae]KUO16207.1 hypothetical protein AQJ91_36880 [Streptomyces dysideae]